MTTVVALFDDLLLGSNVLGMLRAAGAEITEEPTDQEYGERRFMARDPEGHAWAIVVAASM